VSRLSPVTFRNFSGLLISPPFTVNQGKRIYKIILLLELVWGFKMINFIFLNVFIL